MRKLSLCLPILFFVLTACTNSVEKPNILWITLEDTSPQFIGCYGNQDAQTPTIDALASAGVRFNNAFATGTVCSSSRSTLFTGCSTEAMGTGHHRSSYPIPERIKGLGYYLKQNGYYTTNNRKRDYNIADINKKTKEAWNANGKKAHWINRADGQPFFSVYNFNNCHQSRTMTQPWEWYKKVILDKLGEGEEIAPDEITMPPFYRDSDEMRRNMTRVYNSLKYTDTEIDTLITALKRDGLYENTIIFLYADHGEGIPKGKCNPLGLGYRVPFIVYFPEKYQHLNPWGTNTVTDELVSFEDLVPTILSIAKTEIPDQMEGRPFIGEKRELARRFVFGSRNRLDETMGLSRTVTNGRYVYTRVFMPHLPQVKYQKYSDVADITKAIRKDFAEGKLNDVQSEIIIEERPLEYLYDLKEDKWEINNLADEPELAELKNDMKSALYEHIMEVRDVHFLPEYEMQQRIEDSTAYDLRFNETFLPLKELVEAADLVGKGKVAIEKQLAFCKHQDAAVRYWGAIGLNVQKEAILPYKHEIIALLENETAPDAAIELATIAWQQFRSEKGKQVLEKYALCDHPALVVHALQNILYMHDVGRKFLPVVKQSLEKYSKKKSRTLIYEACCSAEMILYLLEGKNLTY